MKSKLSTRPKADATVTVPITTTPTGVSGIVQHHPGLALHEAGSRYVVVTANCTNKSLKAEQEPILAQLLKHCPYANPYQQRSDGSREKPGTIRTFGVEGQQRIAVCFNQYYVGNNQLPNDNRERRYNWFRQCLHALAKLPNLKSVAFSGELPEDHLRLIADFAQTIQLEQAVVVHLCGGTMAIGTAAAPIATATAATAPTSTTSSSSSTPSAAQGAKVISLRNLQKKIYNWRQLVLAISVVPASAAVVSPATTTATIANNTPSLKRPVINLLKGSSKAPDITSETPNTASVVSATPVAPVIPTVTVTPTAPAAMTPAAPVAITVPIVPAGPLALVKVRPEGGPPVTRTYDENSQWPGSLFNLLIHPSWASLFADPVLQGHLQQVDTFLSAEMEKLGDFFPFYPQPPQQIFRVFQEVPLEKVRVVILGQDPYHANPDEAVGLAFSVSQHVKIPPSLVNIYKEVRDSLQEAGQPWTMPTHGDLSAWARQGVLLLNTALTVQANKPESHLKAWTPFTDRLITLLAARPQQPLIFLLWGVPAKKKAALIPGHNRILMAAHPSPKAAYQGWFGCRHFTKANAILQERGETPIKW